MTLWQPFAVKKLGTISTTAGTFQTFKTYSTQNLLDADFQAFNRGTQLRVIRVIFSPTGVNTFSAQQPLEVQLYWSNIDGTVIAMTKLTSLSLTNRTTLQYTLPRNSAEIREVGDSGSLFSVAIFNRLNTTADSVPVFYDVEASFDLATDAPSIM